jgi:eukaryotic-like serine/threonine-protein kinase
MTLNPGLRLETYEIVGLLGVGGMGEVYQATDTKLGRRVAIKILPAAFSQDPERLARFEREAHVLASLNHSNIATIYGLEEFDAGKFIVMELVEGETLADRIARGPLPIHEALAIGEQICDALEAAHEGAIIHRDLKPANVKILPEGKVKVLDFGLAKAIFSTPENPSLSHSPTLSLAATNAGVILGTAAYMSPEQARGEATDERSDVFSFGCVLYEMLTGQQAFQGKSVSDILAGVLRVEPDFSILSPKLNPRLYELLRRCLSKEVKRRWHAVADLRIELEAIQASPIANPSITAATSRQLRPYLPWTLCLLLLIAGMLTLRSPMLEAPEVRLDITAPPTADAISLAISPDGRHIAFLGLDDNKSVLLIRDIDSIIIRSIAGTEGAIYPFWSPDGRSIGFFADGKLKRVELAGGTPRVLASAPNPRGGTWNSDGVILFAPAVGALYRVSAAGGEAVPVTKVNASINSHRFPNFLPDGNHFLFYGQGNPANSGLYISNLAGSAPRRLISADSSAQFQNPNRLLYTRQRTLFALGFDPNTLEVTGEPIPVADEVVSSSGLWTSAVAASQDGTIVYRRATAALAKHLASFDRSGKEIAIPLSAGFWDFPEFGPDTKRLAVHREVDGNTDIWMIDLDRGVGTRLTSDPSPDVFPKWSPDGRWMGFSSARKGPYQLFRKLAIGAQPEELVLESAHNNLMADWSSDGRFILYRDAPLNTGYDVQALQLSDKKSIPVATTIAEERDGQFSPDVRWVAFSSDETGRPEVYVQQFPEPAGKIQISTDGGEQPRWRGDGQEVYYIAPDKSLMTVSIAFKNDAIEAGKPAALFRTQLPLTSATGDKQHYAVSPDGQRFVLVVSEEHTAASPITAILNWRPKP